MNQLLERYREADQLGEELKQKLDASSWLAWLEKLEGCASLGLADGDKRRNALKQLGQEFRLTEGRLREGVEVAERTEAKRTTALARAKTREQTLQSQLPPSLVALMLLYPSSAFRD
jgi:hypothetical protein